MYTLYSYYRSSCSWRVRLALELKGLHYELRQVNLLKDEQSEAWYIDEYNPLGVVPALCDSKGDVLLTQSVAIMEYLEEETSKGIALLPTDPLGRAIVRQLVQVIAADCQPLQNLHVLRKVKAVASLADDEEVRNIWGRPFIQRALHAYTKLIVNLRGKFSYGDAVSMADLCLIPQLYNARRFGINVEEEFPILHEIEQNFLNIYSEAHTRAHPDNSQ